jgi:soluble lytic murein transglycosylase
MLTFRLSHIRRFSWLVLLAAAPTFAQQSHTAADDPYRRERAEFMRAYAAIENGTDQDADASEALRSYPLFPYLQAARLRRAVIEAPVPGTSDERVETFLTLHSNAPAARELRSVWLESLAERKEWSRFLAHYVDTSADDALRCQSFRARIDLDRLENLEQDVAKQWLTPQSLPDCEQAFDWLRARNALTPQLIEQRAKLALEKGNIAFAKQMIALLPPERATPLTDWAALLERPRSIDQFIATPSKQIEPAVLLSSWTKLARTDRDGAIARFDDLVRARGWNARDASPYALALALTLSWDRRPEALHYFGLVDAADLDDNALEWQTRAALWAKDWSLVSRTIGSMSTTTKGLARWRYWSARAAEHAKTPEVARQLYRSVLLDDNYYSAMAAARLGEEIAPRLEKLPVDRTQLRELEQLPEFVRARELYWSALRPQAMIEWIRGFQNLSEPARTQAIHLAARWGWYEQAVATATQQRQFNDYTLLYPRPYDREVRKAAKLTSLPPELIYAVLRQESLYRPDAMSSAGARGLLQLMPETARQTARTWKQPRPSADDLFDPNVNVPLGAAQLRTMINRFGGQTPVALAGYNAGPNAAARWVPASAIESDIWVENIPYNETRTYVQRVLWHSIVFAWLRSGEAQRTDAWVTRIGQTPSSAMVGANGD